jgi:hypothetical protein
MRTYLIIFILAVAPCWLGAQTMFQGRVTDRQSHEPLENAVVRLGKDRSVLTDAQGNFRLTVKGPADSVWISFVGYKTLCICAAQCCDDSTCCRNGVCLHAMDLQMDRQDIDLRTVTIVPAPHASFHTISLIDLRLRPVSSAQDLMRLVPGLFLGQHQGGGLAEHIFYRGFDADHGTDVNVSVDGVPVNLVSHIHGQGFADLHFLIPELVTHYDYGKGPYYAGYGDFTTAGYVAFRTADVLDRSEVKLEGGQFNTGRVMAKLNLLNSNALKHGQSAYLAGEAAYTDGPFDWAQHLRRLNIIGKYNATIDHTKLTVSLSAFESGWRSSGEIPQRAVESGMIGQFGYIDSAQGGSTGRVSASVKARTDLKDGWLLENQAYYMHYYFTLHYNPTFFAEDSVHGDQLRQQERRDLAGYNGQLTKKIYFGDGGDLQTTFGLGAQANWIGLSTLEHTMEQHIVLDTLQAGQPREYAVNGYADENYHWRKWLVNGGLRLDWMGFRYRDFVNPPAAGRQKLIASPKLNISYTSNTALQFYLKLGKGYHSNDARVVVGQRGLDVLPAAYGADLGVNWKPVPGLIVNAAIWTLGLQQEFIYDADEGTMDPGGKTLRKGVDLSMRYQLTTWLFGNIDLNYCRARDLQAPKGENYLPLSVPFSSTGGLEAKFRNGWNAAVSYRYMSDRPANADNSLVAKGYFVTDLTANYTRRKWEMGVEVQNLLNTTWREAQFETTSRMRGEPAPVDDISFTPGTPFFAKLKFGIFF